MLLGQLGKNSQNDVNVKPQRGLPMNNPQWSEAELGVGWLAMSTRTPEGFTYLSLLFLKTEG